MKTIGTIVRGTFARRLLPASLLLFSFAALTAGSALAQVINPSFEAAPDFTGYSTGGATSKEDGPYLMLEWQPASAQ